MIPASRRRLWVLHLVVAALIISLGVRLWDVQVLNTRSYSTLAAQDMTQSVVVPSVRGEILDDTGQPMVDNTTALVVSVNIARLVQRPGYTAVLSRVAKLLHMSPRLISEKVRLCTKGVKPPCWAGSPYQPVPVAQNVSDRIALQIMESPAQYPDVTAQVQPIVTYPKPDHANPAQVLGYLQPITPQEVKQRHLTVTGFSGVDLVGQAGLEQEYDAQLRGTPGIQKVAVNADGVVTGTVSQTDPKSGDDLVTSINAPLQTDLQNILTGAIHKARSQGDNGAKSGAAVVLTTTGRVVAMASYPNYNPSVWTGGISQQEFNGLFGSSHGEPILNRATQGQYAPGSTFKVTTTAAAVQQGYSLYGQYNCPASVNIGGHKFINDGNPNEGAMSFSEALVQSCDTVYYQLGYDMWLKDHPAVNARRSPKAPIQPMVKMEMKWGFGQDTGVDLPEQSTGAVPTRQWLYYYWKDNAHTGQDWCKYGKQYGSYVQQIEYQDCRSGWVWEPGQAAIAAIGQGYVTVTPLQLANAYAALANGGTLYSPRVGEALISPEGKVVKRINPPVIRHLPVAHSTLAYMRSALRGVVTGGTAAGAFGGFPLNKVCVAGKTGTAQIYGKLATSVFASFAPCVHPKYVVVVMIPGAGYGADTSAPAVRKIWDSIYGLEGQKAALPNGRTPSSLPTITASGSIKPPASHSGGKS
ncbi:MAG TPA: penicillin-binding protein 2 [Streptosporangiaceae bacterium]|jgi:penicillin-binding protein 2|nr:penicillin-binding protein 2 [Streptosporangiaceae bacterium]